MMKMQKKSDISTDKTDRRRGRPAGKNRKPLSLEERRARNAQYERERRIETADAMSQLAEAACCDSQIANAELLATVISQLQWRVERKMPEDIEDLKRANENLESQIAALQSRLGPDVDIDGLYEDSNDSSTDELIDDSSSNSQIEEPKTQSCSNSQTIETKECHSDFRSTTSEVRRSSKIRKTSKSSSVSGAYASESDSSISDWSKSRTAPKLYQLRQRRQKVSEQSESTTSTYLYDTETSQITEGPANEPHSDNTDQFGADHPMNAQSAALSAIPEQEEYAEHSVHSKDQTDTALLETLSEGGMQIINEWLEFNETLNARTDQDNIKVRTFLDFDNFLLDINA